jgi:type IX secretion system substrate protein
MRTLESLLPAIALIAATSTAHAAWITDPGPTGLLVRHGAWEVQPAVTDGSGGVLVAFGEVLNIAENYAYLQKIDATGSLPWGANGILFGDCSGSPASDYFGPALAADAGGGAVAVWLRSNATLAPGIVGQRIDAGGTILWPHAYVGDGVALSPSSGAVRWPWWADRDGTGSFFAAWMDGSAPVFRRWVVQRVDGAGTVLWGTAGITLNFASATIPAFVQDGAGGVIVFWYATGASGNLDIFAQRIGSGGTLLWGPGGVTVCPAAGDQGITAHMSVAAASDGAGGACVVWVDKRTDAQGDLYAQRVDPSGAVQWTAGGVPLCAVTGAQLQPAIVPDGTGGLTAAWQDDRSSGTTGIDLYAQRIGGDGVARWADGGVVLCNAPGDQLEELDDAFPRSNVASDGTGGMFVGWSDGRPDALPGSDIFAQHLDASGVALWPALGLRFGATSATLQFASVVPDASGGCTVLWSATVGGVRDIYARNSGGPTTAVDPSSSPASFALRGASPNPALGQFTIAFSLVEQGDVRVDVLDVAGRLVWRRDESGLGPGSHAVRSPVLRPGLYVVRLTQGLRLATTKAVVIR